MRRPTFLILGGAKCGTSSIRHYMNAHPQVFFSTPKEPIFFEAEYEQGLDFYWRKYFEGWSGEAAIGEARVYNLYLPYVADHIREALPDARLIAILRNPVERAYSQWWHRFSRGQEKLSFGDAIDANLEALERGRSFEGASGEREWRRQLKRRRGGTRHRTYVDQGYYAAQLRRYLDVFPRSQLEILLFDDLGDDARAVVRRLFEFVGVDPHFEIADLRPQNVSLPYVQSAPLASALDAYGSTPLPRLVPEALKRRLRPLLQRPAAQPLLPASEGRRLARLYEAPNRELEELLGRDLSGWSAPG